MGKLERKVRQSIRRESRVEFKRIQQNILKHKPKWIPMYFWSKIVNIILDQASENSNAT